MAPALRSRLFVCIMRILSINTCAVSELQHAVLGAEAENLELVDRCEDVRADGGGRKAAQVIACP